MSESNGRDTKYLNNPSVSNSDVFLPIRATGPLNEPLPWVIELRVVGTPSTIQVQVHETMIIGRNDPQRGVYPTVDLGAYGGQNKGVSRQHAVLLVRENRIYAKDLGSVNGTRLNGFLLSPEQEYRLRHADELEIGQVRLQVRFVFVPTIANVPKEDEDQDPSIPVLGSGQPVLVIEENQQVANVFSLALRHAGFKVTVVNTAMSAVSVVSQKMPSLIVMDLMLPDMNGLDLMHSIRKLPQGNKVSIIVCSGATGGFQMHQALESGARFFLGKPVSIEDLLKAVREVFEGESRV